jgi:small subunit ribosomal protein S8
MMTDPISDMLTRIRNAQKSKKAKASMPFSKLKKGIADILVKEGYLACAEVVKEGSREILDLVLKYQGNEPGIREIKRESRPGRRVYCKNDAVPTVLEGFGIAILSTPKGLLTNKEARKERVGGELICTVY